MQAIPRWTFIRYTPRLASIPEQQAIARGPHTECSLTVKPASAAWWGLPVGVVNRYPRKVGGGL